MLDFQERRFSFLSPRSKRTLYFAGYDITIMHGTFGSFMTSVALSYARGYTTNKALITPNNPPYEVVAPGIDHLDIKHQDIRLR